MAAFYAGRNHEALWISNGSLNDRARRLLETLQTADIYGLDPKDYRVPALSDGKADTVTGELASTELKMTQAAIIYIRHANGGRFDQTRLSRFLDRKARPINVASKLQELSSAADPATYLKSQHPQNRQFRALVAALAKARAAKGEIGERIRIPRGPVLKYGMKHPQIALVRRRLGVPVINNVVDDSVYDARLQTAVIEFQKSAGLQARGVIGVKTRFALNAPRQDRRKQIIANMERWRWMPRDLGSTHIRVNIPEYKVRVVRNNKLVHEERIIVGKPTNKTPVFSDEMETVVFNPYWNVPQSIIWGEMNGRIPSRGFEGGVRNGRMWIRQKPGPKNALGKVKFMFPNKHAVYLHDTPQKALFNKTRRAFSHGCVRVRNPLKLAEVIFSINGWPKSRTDRKWASSKNTPVTLKKRIPVHLTYFTLWADKNGKLVSFNDVYGHDNRIYAAATKGIAYSKSRFPEVRKKKIEPRIASLEDDDISRRRTDNWWFPTGNSGSYWGVSNARPKKRQRTRIYRKQQRRKQVAFDDFFSLF